MILDLDKLLKDELKEGQILCPVMSRFEPVQAAPLQDQPGLMNFTVPCVGRKCGMFNRCFNVSPGNNGITPPK